MTKTKDLIIIYILLLLEILILTNSKTVIYNINNSSLLFITKTFPSLYPTMIIGLLLTKLNFYKIVPKFINNIFNKLFNFNNIHTSIFISALICGSPSNAVFINEYLENNLITKKEAESLLCCTHFINPLFIINAIGIEIFNSAFIGFLIILGLIASNLFKAFILRNDFSSKNINISNNTNNKFIDTFFSTIKSSIISILNIFSIVITFNILLSLITNVFNLNSYLNVAVNIILELTSGIYKIKYLNLSKLLKIFLSYYSLSFGGLSICLQTLFMIQNKKIKHLKYFIFRLF